MRLFRIHKGSYLAPFWTVLLIFSLVAFAARAPLARFHASTSDRPHFPAVLTDQDSMDDGTPANSPGKILSLTPDGQIATILHELISIPVRSTDLRVPAEVPFILPLHLLYTQSTSSAL